MKDRIKKIIESMSMSQQEFANFVEISPASLSGIFNDRTRPTLNMVEAIKKKIPNLNTDWLMFGSGEMFVTSIPVTKDNVDSGNATETSIGGDNDQNSLFGDSQAQHRNAAGTEMTLDFDNGGYASQAPSPAAARRQPLLNIQNQYLPGPKSFGVRNTPNNRVMEIQKNIDIKQHHITEIRIYFDDQTFETFVPAKK